jgi:hypothetical protein
MKERKNSAPPPSCVKYLYTYSKYIPVQLFTVKSRYYKIITGAAPAPEIMDTPHTRPDLALIPTGGYGRTFYCYNRSNGSGPN